MEEVALSIGNRYRITGYKSCSSAYKKRLLAMGLIPGKEFAVVRRAPLGDPIEIHVNGFSLVLRAKEAEVINITHVDT